MTGVPIGFALARVHARHAARPSVAEWRHLDGARTPAQYLGYARQGGLRDWLLSITEEETQAAVELKLREAYRRHVIVVASWLPRTARPPAHGISRLIDLPALAHLHAGGRAQQWMHDDPVLAPWLEETATVTEGAPPASKWLQAWRTRWPGRRDDPVAARLGRALLGLVTSPQAAPAAKRLHWLFRTHVLDPVGVYAYLGLVIDDLRRLAGGLARRQPGRSRFEETT
jgi:hypothetical protein